MRLLGLRLRSWLGWGAHPIYLRARSAGFTKVLIAYALIFPLMPLAASMLPYIQRYHALPTHVPANGIHYVLYSEIFVCLGGILFLGLPAAASWLLARRGAASQISRIYGRCFAVLLDPPAQMFARIGASRETANWYSLPLDWDTLVIPSEDQLELDVLATGWVERVRRSGSQLGEVCRPAPTEEEFRPVRRSRPARPDEFWEALEAREQSERARQTEMERERWGDASKDERKEMRSFARQADLGWRTSPGYIAATGWTCVAGGIVLGLGYAIPVSVVASHYPASFHDQSAWLALFGGIVFFLLIGLGSVLFGVHYLRAWRRLRPFAHEIPTSATGQVESWLPYRDTWNRGSRGSYSDRRETLIRLRAVDGSRHIYRVPYSYSHRVRQRGAWVCVMYRPTTERVVDVRSVEEPVEMRRVESHTAN